MENMLGSKTGPESLTRYRDNPYTALWLIPSILSLQLTVPAIRVIIQKTGLGGHGIALGIAFLLGTSIAVAIGSIERTEKRSHRIALIISLGAVCVSLWYWSS